MTYQFPRQKVIHPGSRRYIHPLCPDVERVIETRTVKAVSFPKHWYALCNFIATWIAYLDAYVGIGQSIDSMQRMLVLRGIEKTRWEKIDARLDRYLINLIFNYGRINRQRHTINVANPVMSGPERARYAALLVISAFRLWRGRERPKEAPLCPEFEWSLSWFVCFARARLYRMARRFPWTYTRVARFLIWNFSPKVVRLRISGPILLDTNEHMKEGPIPSRWHWTPGIAYAPVYSPKTDFATGAESTLSGAINNVTTTIPITLRTSFPQDTSKQFEIIVMDQDATTASQPKMNPPTNVEYMLVSAGHGTGAGSFTATRGYISGFPGVAHGSGSYVGNVMTAQGAANLKLNATGFFNSKDQYGAKGDNGTDDAAALQATIDAIPLSGWRNGTIKAGVILLEPGSYVCRTALVMPTTIVNGVYESHVTFAGAGWKASTIRRQNADTNVLLDIKGTITGGNAVTRQTGFQYRDCGVNGADSTTPMMRLFYISFPFFDRCYFQSNNGTAIQGVESQECKLRGSWFDYCGGAVDSNIAGTNVGREAVRILSRDDNATTGTFGFSTDNSNAWWMLMNHWTGLNTDVRGQIVISLNGAPSNSQPHRCNFVMNKIEQQEMGGNPIKLFNCNKIRWEDQEFTGYGLHAGSAAVSWIEANNADEVSIRASVFDDSGNNGVSHAALKVTGCDNWTMEDVTINFATAGAEANPAVIADFTGGTNDNFFFSNIRVAGTRQTPLYSGTVPVNLYTPLRSYILVKTADQLLAGTAAQSVTTLVFASGINSTWTFKCVLFTNNTASDAGGCKVAISAPAGSTVKAKCFGPAASATAFTSALLTASATLSGVAFGTVAVTPAYIEIEGTVVVAGTAGNVQIQAAEGTAADDITIQANSKLEAYRV